MSHGLIASAQQLSLRSAWRISSSRWLLPESAAATTAAPMAVPVARSPRLIPTSPSSSAFLVRSSSLNVPARASHRPCCGSHASPRHDVAISPGLGSVPLGIATGTHRAAQGRVEWLEEHAHALPSRSCNPRVYDGRVKIDVFIVLREHEYETTFGDGYFAYFSAVFRTRPEAEAFALGARYARPKEHTTGWRYHVRSGSLVCEAGAWTLTTDRRGGEHVDRDSEGVATDYAALARELGVLEPTNPT